MGFVLVKFDNTLFSKLIKKDILLIKIYVYDIIFGSTNEILCIKFLNLM